MKKIYLLIILICYCLLSGCYSNSENDLFVALEDCKNYTYTIKYDDGMTLEYFYNNTNIEVVVNNENISKLVYCNSLYDGSKFIIKKLNDGTTLKYEPNTAEFNELINEYFIEVHLNNLLSNEFNFNGIVYTLKKEKLASVWDRVFKGTIEGSLEEFNVVVKNQLVNYIDVTYSNNGTKYSFTISFNAFGITVVDIPFINSDKTIQKILPSSKLLKVSIGGTLEDILSRITFYVIYEDGTDYIYEADYFKYVCDDYDSYVPASYEIKFNIFGVEQIIIIELIDDACFVLSNNETLQDMANRKLLTYGIPSVGNPKVLVIPVEFTDYKAPRNMKETLEKAFFGNENDTGWESLSSYYYESSYGKLNIQGTVLDVYNTHQSSYYYTRKAELGQSADYMIIKDALKYYDSQINYDEYDTNKDGYIDSIYIVYTAPVDYENSSSMWWAYTYEYYTTNYEYYDNVEVDYYAFLGYDFFFENLSFAEKMKINTETLIHETGHLLGLSDYYDYDYSIGPKGGIGGGDMMDHNVGDHNPFSKLLLGWIEPYVVTNSCSVELTKFNLNGKCIILTDCFNSIFDEYYIIDYYSPDGLNKYRSGSNGLFSISGLRIYHIDARIKSVDAISVLEIFEYDNSYTEHKLIKLIQCNNRETIEWGEYSTNQDLLQSDQSIIIDDWYKVENKAVFKISYNRNLFDNSLKINITRSNS